MRKEFYKGKVRGFTLVEVMIVLSIVVLLAAIAIPSLLRARVAANEASAQAALKTLAVACENYAAHYAAYPAAIVDLIGESPPYLTEDLTVAPRDGYNIACISFNEWGYNCTATPTTCNQTGTKTFTIITGAVFIVADCT